MLLRLWRVVTILLVALLQGLAFAHLLERPAKLQYDATLYLTLQKTLYVQWGPPNIGIFGTCSYSRHLGTRVSPAQRSTRALAYRCGGHRTVVGIPTRLFLVGCSGK